MASQLPPAAIIALGVGALLLLSGKSSSASVRGDAGDPNAPGPQPSTSFDPSVNADNLNAWTPAALEPSSQLVDWLKRKEGFLATKTYLGDGGATLGYGHYEPAGPRADALPDTITEPVAAALFANDIQTRAVQQVVKYVNVPVTQNQFDALVSLAYNLSPGSFSHIADAVNAGQGLDPVIFQFVRPGTQFEAGLTARRQSELAMFDTGVYA